MQETAVTFIVIQLIKCEDFDQECKILSLREAVFSFVKEHICFLSQDLHTL